MPRRGVGVRDGDRVALGADERRPQAVGCEQRGRADGRRDHDRVAVREPAASGRRRATRRRCGRSPARRTPSSPSRPAAARWAPSPAVRLRGSTWRSTVVCIARRASRPSAGSSVRASSASSGSILPSKPSARSSRKTRSNHSIPYGVRATERSPARCSSNSTPAVAHRVELVQRPPRQAEQTRRRPP